MTAKAWAAIAATIVTAVLLPPAAATAHRPPTSGHGGSPTAIATLALRGTNGYLVNVNLINRRQLSLTAFANGSQVVGAEYTLKAPQPQGSDQIRASLGRLGRIDLRFISESESEKPSPSPVCKGEKDRIQKGTFVGQISFRGENGYTEVRATKAPGSVLTLPASPCRKSKGHGPHQRSPHQRARALIAMAKQTTEPGVHVLKVKAKTKSPAVEFEASRLSAAPKGKEIAIDTFAAIASRDRGRIHEEAIAAALLVRGPYFKVPDLAHPAADLLIEPPAPFLGSATFRHESADQASWEGDLRVELPGFGLVSLAGAGAGATLCADSGCPASK